MNKIALSQWTRTRITLIHRRPLSLGCSLSFHQDKGQPKSRFGFSLSSGETQKSHSQFESYYADVKNRFNSVDKDTKYSIGNMSEKLYTSLVPKSYSKQHNLFTKTVNKTYFRVKKSSLVSTFR